MSKLELGYLIREALRHTLQQQELLLSHKHVIDILPVLQRLAHFISELEDWYAGKYHLNNRSEYFLAQAVEIETFANNISEEIWGYVPLNLVLIFEKIR